MKKKYQQSLKMLFITFILLICNVIYAQENSSFISVSGVVKDKQSKKKLEYVNISVLGTNIGTVTNADGEFTIKIKEPTSSKVIEISHIGYLNSTITIDGKKDLSDQIVFLAPNANVLDEVVIRAQDPRMIVEEAIRKIPSNYSINPNLLTGFYRETVQKGNKYINISEAVIDIYKTSYKEINTDRDRVQIFKGRSLLSQKKSDTLVVKLLGGPNLSIYLDVVKNPDLLLSSENLGYYSFRIEESVMINNRPQFVISFQPQVILPYSLYYGKIFIDKEKLSFTRTEFKLNIDDISKATQSILKKKPLGLRFKPVEVSFIINYTQKNDITYLSYIRNEVRFKCDWKRRLFSTNYSILSEMVITDRKTEDITTIPFKMSFKSNQSLSDKVSDFMDNDFWGAYNIIEPTESLESAVNKLKKQYK